LNGREPQICRGSFSRVSGRCLIVIFFGHARSVATRVPEKNSAGTEKFTLRKKISSAGFFHLVLVAASHKLSSALPTRETHALCVKFSRSGA
jgi:hypothetical protein